MKERIDTSRRWAAILLVIPLMVAITAALAVHHSATAAGTPLTVDLPLAHVADIPLPGRATRLDYESYDPERHLLFIAHLGDSEVIVFDTQNSRVVARIGNIAAVHGVLVVPADSRVYASATGTNEVVAIDEATLKITARMQGGVYPDGTAYSPDTRKLYVSDETGRASRRFGEHTTGLQHAGLRAC